MCWSTSRPFPSVVSVEELGEQLRLKPVTLMDREDGLLNPANSFWICWRMLRAMLRFELILGYQGLTWWYFGSNGYFIVQVKGLDVDSLYISHIQVNQAQQHRRRTYRAHGRINGLDSLGFWCGLMIFAKLLLTPLFQPTCHLPAILSWFCLRKKLQWKKRYWNCAFKGWLVQGFH